MKNESLLKASKYTFWIGTEAELIKLFPIMLEMQSRSVDFNIIATGQNEIINSKILSLFSKNPEVYVLTYGPRKKTTSALLVWFFYTFLKSLKELNKSKNILLIHGDTISTLLGAAIGFLKGYKVAHVEAGLRSYNYFKPFPEEIDRVLSSLFVDIHFCPNEDAMKNLKSKSGQKVNTYFNTLYDSLMTFKNTSFQTTKKLPNTFFIFVLHRQENLYDEQFVIKILDFVLEKANSLPCVFILHEPTEQKLAQLGVDTKVRNHKNIQIFHRLPYFEFMELLFKAEFLVTDGGSNQEESYYLGIPCLVLRNVSERSEGIGHNVLMEREDFTNIESFFTNYQKYRKPFIETDKRPCQIIVNYLENSDGK